MFLRNLVLRATVLHFFRGKKIYYVTGMRRSGNHAFIRWLINALEERLIELTRDSDNPYLNYSGTGRTVFLNEINMLEGKEYLRMLWENRKLLGNCQYLVISTEDCGPNYRSWRIPEFNHAIYVKRTALNVIASRIQSLLKKAAEGRGWVPPRMYVNGTFFTTLSSWINPPSAFHIWEYDKWITSEIYRLDFLHSLGLEEDIQPTISSEGGGSSFTGENKVPVPEKALTRFRQVEFTDPILALLSENKKILTQSELEYLDREYSIHSE